MVDLQQGWQEMYNVMLEESVAIKERLQYAKDKLNSAKEGLENSHLLCVRRLRDQKKEDIKRMRER